MCTVSLPPRDNPIAVINLSIYFYTLFSKLSFPTSLRLLPFHSLWYMIEHHRSQLVSFCFIDLISMSVTYGLHCRGTKISFHNIRNFNSTKRLSGDQLHYSVLNTTLMWVFASKDLEQSSSSLSFIKRRTHKLVKVKSYKA